MATRLGGNNSLSRS